MSHNPNDIFDPRRYGLITGSKCSVLFPKKSAEVGQRQYAKELANQLYFKFYDNNSTWQTEHGHLCESSAFEYLQLEFDECAEYQPEFKVKGSCGGQADCLGVNVGYDFKCPTTLKKWLDYLHEGIDEEQYHQAQMYMYLYDKNLWYICAFLQETEKMGNEGEVYPVPHDKRMIYVPVERQEDWASKLDEVAPKIIAMRDFFYNKLKTQFDEL